MSRKIICNLFLREPGTGVGVVFVPAGSELPDWATDLVGPHVYETSGDTLSTPANVEPTQPVTPVEVAPPTAAPQEEPVRPDNGASLATWKKYAKEAHGLTFDRNVQRDDIIAAVDEIEQGQE